LRIFKIGYSKEILGTPGVAEDECFGGWSNNMKIAKIQIKLSKGMNVYY